MVFKDLNIIDNLEDFATEVSSIRNVEANLDNNYDDLYKKYVQLYPRLKGIQ